MENGEIASEFRNAAVLYLDLCHYTQLTASQEAIRVAELIHSVFSQFDMAVQARNVFKMDTIGDAYICACWIDESNQRQVCQRMVALARDMVEIIDNAREEFSVNIACRIGIATGKCLAGAIGKLQPRYQIMGEAVELAHELEGAAEKQGINVSEQVKQIL
uniref:Guanylate cyclase domain-containing protein n=1 Tax=Guillardia theta (strain CCMP2712) TaxID=905079 RepID=A0A0C3UAA6_GUITC